MSDLEIKINQDMVKGIIESKIRAAVVAEFSKNNTQIIDHLVQKGLNQKVDKETGKASDSGWNAEPIIEYMFKSIMREEIRKSAQEMAETQREEIRKAITKEMSKSREKMVKAFLEGVMGSINSPYLLKINYEVQEPKK